MDENLANNASYAKRHKALKILAIIASAVVLLSILLTVVIGNYLVNFAIVRQADSGDISPAADPAMAGEDTQIILQNREAEKPLIADWLSKNPPVAASIQSDDGLNLYADYFTSAEPASHTWALLVHGYKSERTYMRSVGLHYAEKGYNVLTPDMRGHGESDGKYIGMGWLDRRDLILWIQWILEKDPQAQIVLHGISMGGATVMMVSGEEDLPDAVKVIVDDCGYTSVWDIFADELAYLYHLPTFPVLNMANIVGNIRAGYDFKKASALNQVTKSTTPILFIHGENDTFIHPEMAQTLYDAASCDKELLYIPGAGHGQARQREPETYYNTVFGFIEKYIH